MSDTVAIECTKEELFTLLKAAYLADWMANAHSVSPANSEYAQLLSKVLAKAKVSGMERYVDEELPEDKGVLFPTDELADHHAVRGIIERYDLATFVDEFAARFAERDFRNSHNREQRRAMDADHEYRELAILEQEYLDELKIHGFERFIIDDDAEEGG